MDDLFTSNNNFSHLVIGLYGARLLIWRMRIYLLLNNKYCSARCRSHRFYSWPGFPGKLFAEHTAMKIIEDPPYNNGFPVPLPLANARNMAFYHPLPCLGKPRRKFNNNLSLIHRQICTAINDALCSVSSSSIDQGILHYFRIFVQ